MAIMRFYRRYGRAVAAVCALSLAVSLALGVTSVDIDGERFGMLYVWGMGIGILLTTVAGALPRARLSLVWLAFLGAGWAAAAASGPGVASGLAAVLSWVTAGVCTVFAMAVCALHYDVSQHRPVSRL
ncbi:MAG: hypothetical protein LBJ08_12300 [Bifidobacteriaceae bacterium]|jgi:hypothetical protein|nr:hypothetical protein [Bifidobacteriaceae bacterium]